MSENVIFDRVNAQLQTTNATSTQILSYDLNDNFSGQANFIIIGRNVSTGATCSMNAAFTVKNGVGSASVVGSVVYSLPLQSDVSLATVTATVGTSGASITISVAGVAATTIDWLCELSVGGIYP